MIKSILVLLVILSGLQTSLKFNEDQTPPGMVAVDKTLYIDKTEVRNIEYRIHIHWIKRYKGENSKEYLNALPDTSQKIRILFQGNNQIQEMDLDYYFNHPNFNNYPVVSISYEQAIEYCKWRTDMINEGIYRQKNKSLKDEKIPDNIPIIYKLRLPTKSEWIKVANQGIDLKYKKKLENEGIKYEIIEQVLVTGNFLENGENMPVNVDFGNVNNTRCYNIYGNVAEMSNNKGIAFGGSYCEKLSDFKIDKEYHYDLPKVWIGFRCVAEKIEN